MPVHDTDTLVVLLTGTGDELPDPLFSPPRLHHLVNPTNGAVVVSSTGATPFTDLTGTDVATISVPARSVAIVKTEDGTHWVAQSNDQVALPLKNGVVILDPSEDQLFRIEIIDDGTPSGNWPNRTEIWYTGPGGNPPRHRVAWNNEFGEGRYTAAKNSTVPFRIYLQDSPGVLTHTANGFEIVDNPVDRNVIVAYNSDGELFIHGVQIAKVIKGPTPPADTDAVWIPTA